MRDHIAASGGEVFCPTSIVESRWTDRIQRIERPEFPGYLFVRFPAAAANEIRAMRGVVQILSLDQEPTPIPDEVIDSLKIAFDSRAGAPLSLCPYVPGDSVRVKRGAFAGTTGTVARIKGNTILSIPIEILGRSVSVQIEAADVTKE